MPKNFPCVFRGEKPTVKLIQLSTRDRENPRLVEEARQRQAQYDAELKAIHAMSPGNIPIYLEMRDTPRPERRRGRDGTWSYDESERVDPFLTDPEDPKYDIADELLRLFRVTIFLNNFEVDDPVELMHVIATHFIRECLALIKPGFTKQDAEKALDGITTQASTAIPGDPGWKSDLVTRQVPEREKMAVTSWLTKLRQELAQRLVNLLYRDDDAVPDPHILAFKNRKFRNESPKA